MKKRDLIALVHEELDITYKEAKSAVESTLEIIKEELEQGRAVTIPGFGKWFVLTKRSRLGRNPQTGEAMMIKGRVVVSFKVSLKLKQVVQSKEWSG